MNSVKNIINTKFSDLEFIYSLFDDAIIYQKSIGFPVWPDYDKNTLQTDIENKLQFKIVIKNQNACIFSICFNDKIVRRQKDRNDGIYLHRIVVNKNFKGMKLFGYVLEWAKKVAKKKKLGYIRMDTWADNSSIIKYYKSFGFQIVEYYITPNNVELPIQQRNNKIVLLELENKIARNDDNSLENNEIKN